MLLTWLVLLKCLDHLSMRQSQRTSSTGIQDSVDKCINISASVLLRQLSNSCHLSAGRPQGTALPHVSIVMTYWKHDSLSVFNIVVYDLMSLRTSSMNNITTNMKHMWNVSWWGSLHPHKFAVGLCPPNHATFVTRSVNSWCWGLISYFSESCRLTKVMCFLTVG